MAKEFKLQTLNWSGRRLTVDPSDTGSFLRHDGTWGTNAILTSQTGQFASAANLATTGLNLSTSITSLSGYIGITSIERNIPVVLNGEVDIGNFSTVHAHNLGVFIAVNVGSISLSKYFHIVTKYDTANVWKSVVPLVDAGVYNGTENFALDHKMNGNDLALRIRRTLGAEVNTATIRLINYGHPLDSFVPSTGTGIVSAPATTVSFDGLGSVYYPLTSNPSGFVTSSETGNLSGIFYPRTTNPSGYAGIDQLRNSGVFNVVTTARAMPIAVNDFVEIGQIGSTYHANSFSASVILTDNSISLAKFYDFATLYQNANTGWYEIVPSYDSGPYQLENFAIDAYRTTSQVHLRLRRTSGSVTGLARIKLINNSAIDYAYFTNETNTGSTTAPASRLSFDGLSSVYYPRDSNPSGYISSISSTGFSAYGVEFPEIYNAKRWGAVGNGVADDTAAIQSGLNYICDRTFGALFFPVGNYKITSTLTGNMNNPGGCLNIEGRVGYGRDVNGGAVLSWQGVTGGTLFSGNGINNSIFQDLIFQGLGAKTLVIIDAHAYDNYPYEGTAGSSAATFRMCSFLGGSGVDSALVALCHDGTGSTNQVSEVVFDRCYFGGRGTGVTSYGVAAFEAGNTKNFAFDNCTFAHLGTGIRCLANGNVVVNNSVSALNHTEIVCGSQTLSIDGWESEGSIKFLYAANGANPIQVNLNAINFTGPCESNDVMIDIAGSLVITSSILTNVRTATSPPYIKASHGLLSEVGDAVGSVYSVGNFYWNATGLPFLFADGQPITEAIPFYSMYSAHDVGGVPGAMIKLPHTNYGGGYYKIQKIEAISGLFSGLFVSGNPVVTGGPFVTAAFVANNYVDRTSTQSITGEKTFISPTTFNQTVTASANGVGIGVSPGVPLDVAGTFVPNGTALRLRLGDLSNGANQQTQIKFTYSNTTGYPQWIATRHNGGQTHNAIDFYTNDGTEGAVFPANARHGLTITDGKIGIRNRGPAYQLDVSGDVRIIGNNNEYATMAMKVFNSGQTGIFEINNDGRVVVGNGGGQFAALSVNYNGMASVGGHVMTLTNGADTIELNPTNIRSINPTFSMGAGSYGGALAFYSPNANEILVLRSGRVGINSSFPSATLYVNGSGDFLNGVFDSGRRLINASQTGQFVTTGQLNEITINVLDFGANPALTNNQPAFQAAFDYANRGVGLNYAVYIPKGDFSFTSPVLLRNCLSIVVRGAGKYNTLLSASHAGPVFITDGCWYSSFEDIAFHARSGHAGAIFELDGNSTQTGASFGVQGNTFKNCHFLGDGYAAIGLRICNSGGSAGQGSENLFLNCHFAGCYYAGYLQTGYNSLQNTFIGGNVSACPNYGLYAAVGSFNVSSMGFQNGMSTQTGYDIAFGASSREWAFIDGCRSESLRGVYGGNASPFCAVRVAVRGWTQSNTVDSWLPSHVYQSGDLVLPTGSFYSGYAYRCVSSGTSSSTHPIWSGGQNFLVDNPVTDGTVTWRTLHDNVMIASSLDSSTMKYGRVICEETVKDCTFTRPDWFGGVLSYRTGPESQIGAILIGNMVYTEYPSNRLRYSSNPLGNYDSSTSIVAFDAFQLGQRPIVWSYGSGGTVYKDVGLIRNDGATWTDGAGDHSDSRNVLGVYGSFGKPINTGTNTLGSDLVLIGGLGAGSAGGGNVRVMIQPTTGAGSSIPDATTRLSVSYNSTNVYNNLSVSGSGNFVSGVFDNGVRCLTSAGTGAFVTIVDNRNLAFGGIVSGAQFQTASSSQVANLNASYISGYGANQLIKLGDYAANNQWANGIHIPQTNNILYKMDDRGAVTSTGFVVAGNSYLFDGDYEQWGIQVPPSGTGVLTIDFSGKDIDSWTYPDGYLYVTFGGGNTPAFISGRGYFGSVEGWRSFLPATEVQGSYYPSGIVRLQSPGYNYCKKIELTVVANTGFLTYINEIEFLSTRQYLLETPGPLVTKYSNSEIYADLNLRDSSRLTGVHLGRDGIVSIGKTGSHAGALTVRSVITAGDVTASPYKGNVTLDASLPQYPVILFRSGTAIIGQNFTDISDGKTYSDSTSVFIWRQYGGAEMMRLAFNDGGTLTVGVNQVITRADTGVFYPRFSNPSGYIDSAATGQFASAANLNATGVFITSNYVDRSTAQSIAGVKTFTSNSLFTGNVGINVSAPSEKLHMSGNLKIDGYYNGAVSAIGTNSLATFGNNGVGFAGGNDANSAHLIDIDGIAYQVSGVVAVQQYQAVRFGFQKENTWNKSNEATNLGASFVVYTSSGGGNLSLPTVAEKFRIDSSGKVGIGNTNPKVKLHVNSYLTNESTINPILSYGLIYADGGKIVQSSFSEAVSDTNYDAIDLIHTKAGAWFGGSQNINFRNVDVGNHNNKGLVAQIKGGQTGDLAEVGCGFLAFGTAGTGSTVITERVRIDKSGYMGIGTPSPLTYLHIKSPSATKANLFLQSAAQKAEITMNDNDENLRFINYGTYGGGAAPDGSTSIMFHTSGDVTTPKVTITQAGKMGIGTNAPTEKLQVEGNIKLGGSARLYNVGGYLELNAEAGISYLRGSNGVVINDNNTNPVQIATAGAKVGIGTTTPAYTLDVVGSGNFSQGVYDSGVRCITTAQTGGFGGVSLTYLANNYVDRSTSQSVTGLKTFVNGITANDGITGKSLTVNKYGYGAGIYTFSKTVVAGTPQSGIFSIANTSHIFDVMINCYAGSFSVAKKYTVAHQYGNPPVSNLIVDTGPYGGNDFVANFSGDGGTTLTMFISGIGATDGNYAVTLFLGASPNNIILTEL